jgi:hypothetical protein
MTARSITLTHDGTSSALASQTWEMAFPTPVQFTSFVTDIATADTYDLKIDGSTVVSGVSATAGQTGVTFTPGSPVSLSAGIHTFQLIGTASRAYYYLSSNLGIPSGDSAYAQWGIWQESATRQVPGTVNFTEDGSVLPIGMDRNASSGTLRTSYTWNVTFDADAQFQRFLWFVVTTGTYKLTIDGVDIVTGVSGTNKRYAAFEPGSPVSLAAGTHAFAIVPTTSAGMYFHSGTTPVLGSSHATWEVISETGGVTRMAGLMGFAVAATGSGTAALTLSGSGAAVGAGGGSGALTLTGAGAPAAPVIGSGALSLDATGTAFGPGDASGTGSLSLSASGDAVGAAAGSGGLTLSATGDAAAVAAGAGSLTLSGSGDTGAPPPPYVAAVLADLPIAYYRLGDATDTGFPTTAHDSSGHGHDGTYDAGLASTGPSAIVGDSDPSTYFGGSSAGTHDMQVPFWSGLNTTEFTYETWLEINSVPADNPLFGRTGNPAPVHVSNNSSACAVVHINSGTTSATYSGSVSMWSGWHHVAITRDAAGVLSIYVDGVLDTAYAGSIAPDTSTSEGFEAGSLGLGSLDELALYDYALGADRVAYHYVIGHGASGTASLSLTGSGTVTTASAGGTGSLSLSGLGQVPTPTAGEGFLSLAGDGAAVALVVADTSNALDGLDMLCVGTVTLVRPDVTPPSSVGVKVDKAMPYPQPVMVDGRPT